jgi:MFS transporter, FHS family, glucose/mannose:H+ symporter
MANAIRVGASRTSAHINKPTGLGLIYGAGVAQGLALVTFPAASAIFTSPRGYGFSATRYGLMFLPQVLMAIFASSTASKLARRWSLKRVLLLGLGSDVAAMLLLALSGLVETERGVAYGMLLGATAALGFGFGATLTALNTLAEELSPGREDRAVLTLNALLGTGTALAPALVAVFVGFGVWWMLPVGVACALAVLLWLTLKEHWQIHPGASTGGNVAARDAMPPQFWVFAGATFVYGILETLNGNWASVYLVSQRGVSVQAASWALTAFWAMVTFGRLLFAALSLKISVRAIYIALPFLLAIALQVVSRVRTETGGLSAFGLAGLSCSAFFPLSMSLAGDEFPAQSSLTSGDLIAFYQLGYGMAAFGAGPLRDRGGFLFSTIFSGASALAIVMGILAIQVVKQMSASSRR